MSSRVPPSFFEAGSSSQERSSNLLFQYHGHSVARLFPDRCTYVGPHKHLMRAVILTS